MRRTFSNVLWALVFIAAGVLLILKATGVYDFALFPGWWTVFLIVPALISMVRSGINVGNLILLGVGIVLLLNANHWLGEVNLWLLLAGVLVIAIGLGVLLTPRRGASGRQHTTAEGGPQVSAVFGAAEHVDASPDFVGADVSAVFGGADLDIRQVGIVEEATVRCTAVFGGVSLYVPPDVNLVVTGTPVLGGCSNHVGSQQIEGRPTLYVNYTAVFGGVEISLEKK